MIIKKVSEDGYDIVWFKLSLMLFCSWSQACGTSRILSTWPCAGRTNERNNRDC